jgi:hypothetical protein
MRDEEGPMDERDVTISKLPWQAPNAVPLTDRDSRADVTDAALRNGEPGPVFSG